MLFGTLQANAIDINDSILFEEMFNTNKVFTAEQTLKLVKDTKDNLQESITAIDTAIDNFISGFDTTNDTIIVVYTNDVGRLESIELRLTELENNQQDISDIRNEMVVLEQKIEQIENNVSTVFVERMNNVEQELRNMRIITLRIGDNDIFVLAPPIDNPIPIINN